MELTEARITSIVCLGLGSLLIGSIPFCCSNKKRQQCPLLASSLLCFGGGVLLSTSLVHILPEVRETMPKYQKYAEAIFCCGFFLLYVIDEIMHLFYNDTHEEPQLSTTTSWRNPERRSSHSGNNFSYGSTERSSLLPQLPHNPSFYKARSDSELFIDNLPPSQVCHVGHQEPCNYGPVVNIGLLLALCVHAILEGLVIGLESMPSKVLLLLWAVASHKLVVSFCLGIELTSNPRNSTFKNFVSILIFSLGSVAGIVIGILISKLPQDITELPIPVLQAITGGTLLYVTTSEIIPRERARWHQKHEHTIANLAGLVQFVSIGIGFASMTALSMNLAE